MPISEAAQKQLRTTQVIVYEPWEKTLPEGLEWSKDQQDRLREMLKKGNATPTPKPSATP